MQVKKQQSEPDMEQWTCLKLGKKYVKALYCHPAYLTCIKYIMRNAGMDESQAGFKIARRNRRNLRYADNTTLMAESKGELKSLLMKVKGEVETAGLKLNIYKTKIMASGPITSWQIDGAISDRLFSWPPKSLQMVTAAMKLKHTCSFEEKLWQT